LIPSPQFATRNTTCGVSEHAAMAAARRRPIPNRRRGLALDSDIERTGVVAGAS
jgi:hypothetical protein